MTEDLFYWKEIYFIEIAEIRYGWGFILLKKKQSIAGIRSIEKVDIRYGWKLILLKKLR